MKREYLPDATNFQDIPVRERRQCHLEGDQVVMCPVCKGHGIWNLMLDASGEGKHFQAHCSQCNGWGWVAKGTKDESCVHEYRELSQDECVRRGIPHYGMFCHIYECRKCGKQIETDSSG